MPPDSADHLSSHDQQVSSNQSEVEEELGLPKRNSSSHTDQQSDEFCDSDVELRNSSLHAESDRDKVLPSSQDMDTSTGNLLQGKTKYHSSGLDIISTDGQIGRARNDFVPQTDASSVDVYDFDEEGSESATHLKSARSKRSSQRNDDGPTLRAKQRCSSTKGVESYAVSTGSALKLFLANHPILMGLYMNKGKRQVKRHLVKVVRDVEAVDCGSWTRGANIMMRNRLDDHFVLTEDGQKKLAVVQRKEVRDERVVCW